MVSFWGKPCYIWMGKSAIFMGNLAWLCKVLGIVHHYIIVNNSKANRQVEIMIWMLKDCIQCSLMEEPASLWTNNLALAPLLLQMTASRIMGHCTIFMSYRSSAAAA